MFERSALLERCSSQCLWIKVKLKAIDGMRTTMLDLTRLLTIAPQKKGCAALHESKYRYDCPYILGPIPKLHDGQAIASAAASGSQLSYRVAHRHAQHPSLPSRAGCFL